MVAERGWRLVAMSRGLLLREEARYDVVMHVDIIPNRGSRPAYLLRESYREEVPRVRKRTLANLSSLPDEQIFAIRAILRGEQLAPAAGLFGAIPRVRTATCRRFVAPCSGWALRS